VFFQGAILIDSIVPAVATPTSCNSTLDTGFTYALNVANGGIFNNVFSNFRPLTGTSTGILANDVLAAGVRTDATGSVFVVGTAENVSNIVYQTTGGGGGSQVINVPPNSKSKRLTWVERR